MLHHHARLREGGAQAERSLPVGGLVCVGVLGGDSGAAQVYGATGADVTQAAAQYGLLYPGRIACPGWTGRLSRRRSSFQK